MDRALFSDKQRRALTFWREPGYDALICDGAVRSGKTLCSALSFVLWATCRFRGQSFGLCGKTVPALRRNLTGPLLRVLRTLGFTCMERAGRGYLEMGIGGRSNRFYLFGGRDESSASLIQGMTLAGVLLDEAALMPRSFVEQALARCSVEGSKFYFSCNPSHPGHWFYREWICKAAERRALYLHFTMEDNPSLSPAMRQRYASLYSGSFYQRFVLGRWSAAQGAVYPMFSPQRHVVERAPACERYYISCDYGIQNPASFGLWGYRDGIWYRAAEYYHDGRAQGQRTDEEHYRALETLAGPHPVQAVVVDPSAASFIECIRRHGRFLAIPAQNQLLDGIRRVAVALQTGRLRFAAGCSDILREFSLYHWQEDDSDLPAKENDHAMDDLRYFVSTVLDDSDRFYALPVSRRTAGG